ncbi:MAG: hypothetical protein RLN85_14635, partial [Pseudomonadales bacterium]
RQRPFPENALVFMHSDFLSAQRNPFLRSGVIPCSEAVRGMNIVSTIYSNGRNWRRPVPMTVNAILSVLLIIVAAYMYIVWYKSD